MLSRLADEHKGGEMVLGVQGKASNTRGIMDRLMMADIACERLNNRRNHSAVSFCRGIAAKKAQNEAIMVELFKGTAVQVTDLLG